MSDIALNASEFASHRGAPALTPALLMSLAVHAMAGGLLYQAWQHAPVVPPQPLLVTMVDATPAPVVAVPPAPPHTHHHETHVPQHAPQPVQSVQRLPAPELVAVERAAAAPVTVPPVVETPPSAPAAVKVAVAPSAPARAETIEPPHFDVAYLNNPRPAYPPMARRLGLEGLVVLRVQVSAKGLPDQIVIAQTSGTQVLDEAALRAVQGWSFVPARLGDKPIAQGVEVPVRFQLKN